VARFDLPGGAKVPHMGWNTVAWTTAAGTLGGQADDWYYFVHSYVARPRDEGLIAGLTDYGVPFCSAVTRGRLFATQFHPEKSQGAGMRLLRAFVESA
jgi:glutamine amidotransferase